MENKQEKPSFTHNGQTFYEGSRISGLLDGVDDNGHRVLDGEITKIGSNGNFWIGQNIRDGDNQHKGKWKYSWIANITKGGELANKAFNLKLLQVNPDNYEIFN